MICRDGIQADIKVCVFIRVNKTPEDVVRAATVIGCERISNRDALQELFEPMFSEALKKTGKQFDFDELYNHQDSFKTGILKNIGTNLDGFILENIVIDSIKQSS